MKEHKINTKISDELKSIIHKDIVSRKIKRKNLNALWKCFNWKMHNNKYHFLRIAIAHGHKFQESLDYFNSRWNNHLNKIWR